MNTKQIDKIIWFGWNFTYDFINKVWGDNPSLENHIQDKFQTCMSRADNVKDLVNNGFFTFLSQLDSENREKLYNYILNQN